MSGTFMLNNRNYTASGNLRLGGDVANPNIADAYDPTQTYNTGDRRIYNDVLYVCNDDNVTGAWDSTKWDSATIDEIISALTAADITYSAGVSVADKLDSLSSLFKVVAFNLASCNVSANSNLALRGNDFVDTTDVIPSGYSPMAFVGDYSTNNNIIFLKIECTQAGGTGVFVVLKNMTASDQTGYIQVKILYIKDEFL